MEKQNPEFVESELVFGVYRNRLHCGNPEHGYYTEEWAVGFSDIDSQWIERWYVPIYKYRPELGGWVYLKPGSASKANGIYAETNKWLGPDLIADSMSLEEAKARFPEAFPMVQKETIEQSRSNG
jgi:hypothetical protein